MARFLGFLAGFAASLASLRETGAGSGSGSYSYSTRSRPESQRATLPMLRFTEYMRKNRNSASSSGKAP